MKLPKLNVSQFESYRKAMSDVKDWEDILKNQGDESPRQLRKVMDVLDNANRILGQETRKAQDIVNFAETFQVIPLVSDEYDMKASLMNIDTDIDGLLKERITHIIAGDLPFEIIPADGPLKPMYDFSASCILFYSESTKCYDLTVFNQAYISQSFLKIMTSLYEDVH